MTLVEGMFIIVPEDEAVLVFEHEVCGGLEAQVSFVAGNSTFSRPNLL